MKLVEAAPRETALESGGYVKGVAIAVVTQNKDDDKLCRVKVSYPWHDKPRDSYWARLAMPMAGKDRGMVLIPEVGDEVLVAFEREDLRFPYVIGALWNGVEGPPVFNGDGKNDKRMFKSRAGSYVLFDDGDDRVVRVALHDGKEITFDRNGIVADDKKGNRVAIQTQNGTITLEAKTRVTINAPAITLQASGQCEIKGGTLTLSGTTVNIN